MEFLKALCTLTTHCLVLPTFFRQWIFLFHTPYMLRDVIVESFRHTNNALFSHRRPPNIPNIPNMWKMDTNFGMTGEMVDIII